MKIYELSPTDGRKSFYGKAKVVIDNNGTETLFISRSASGELERLWTGWSATTGRHIKAFCNLNKESFLAL